MEELIDKYLNGQMTADESAAFEKRCEAEPDFASSVRLHVKAEYVARTHARRSRFEAFNQEYDRLQGDKGSGSSSKRYWIAAAAVIALLLSFFAIYQSTSPSAPQELYAAHVEPFPLSFRRDAKSSEWERLSLAYHQGDYPSAIAAAHVLLADTNQQQAKLWMCLGVSQLMNQQPEAAIRSLQQVASSSSFIENAQWYMALSYLKLGEGEKAQDILKSISNSQHYKKEAAEEILQRLKI